MKNRIAVNLVIYFLLLIIINACVPSKPVKEENKVLPAERLMKKLEANRRKIKVFEGRGILNIQTPQINAKASFEVILKKPDSVKLSIYGPFGLDLAHVLVSKNTFRFYDVMRNDVYEGKTKQDILEKIFKVDLSFDDLMDAFAGAVNLTEKLRTIPSDYKINTDEYILYYNDNERESVYNINISDLAITNYKLSKLPNKPLFEGVYSDFEMLENVPVPYLTKVTNKENNQSITIEYRNIRINQEIDELELTYPSDAKIIKW